MGVAPLHGRGFHSDEDSPGGAPVAVISELLWQHRFGANPSAIGRSFVLEGKPYTIVGVAPSAFQLDGPADVFIPLGQQTEPRMRNREAHFLRVVARLRPGATFAEAQSEIGLTGHQLEAQYPASNRGLGMRVRRLQEEVVGEIRPTLWLLLAAVGLVLAIACVNTASLALTRAISREREFAMRVALGAGRSRLARACFTESLVSGLFGGLLGLFLAKLSIQPFVAFWPGSLPRAEEIRLDWRVLAFSIGLSLLSAFFCGLAPILRIPFRSLEAPLRAGGRTIAAGSRRLYGVFVVSEIALAFVLLVCAGMLGNTLLRLSSLNPGFNPHNVLTARFSISPAALRDPEQIPAAWQNVLDRVRRVPDVESAALSDIIPMRVGENSVPYRTTAAPVPPNQQPLALASSVTPDYLNVMGIPLHAGRFLNERDNEASDPVVVIDENLARHAFGSENAVGRQLWIPGIAMTAVQVVGVVGHVRHWGLAGDDQSRVRDQMYYPFAQVPARLLRFFSSLMSITMRTKTPPLGLVERLRLELRGAAGDEALYATRSMEQFVNASLARQRFLLILFRIFAGLALLLASTGIYGVLAYMTGQRTSEIGVRMAVGATTRDILRMVMRQSLWMVLLGVGVGALGALAAGSVVERLVEGMQPAYCGIHVCDHDSASAERRAARQFHSGAPRKSRRQRERPASGVDHQKTKQSPKRFSWG